MDMNMKRNIVLLFLLIGLTVSAFGQLVQSEQILTKYGDGILQVRWEPSSIEEWKAAQEKGYTVSVTKAGNASEVKRKTIKPHSFDAFDAKIQTANNFKKPFFAGSQKLLFPERFDDKDDQMGSYFADESQSGLDSLRLGFLIYSSIYDFALTEMIGLGASFRVSQGVGYTITIQVEGFSALTKNVMTVNQKREIADLAGEWGDKVVNLEWNTTVGKKHFYGYYTDISEDGFNYQLMDSIPWVNTMDKYNTVENDEMQLIRREFELEENYKTYYIRLRGLDYFGEISPEYSMVIGQGYKQLTLSPFITYADQTEDNKAHIKWMVPDGERFLITRFDLLRADSIDGNYRKVVEDISPENREILYPMEATRNFFRIEAYSTQGPGLSSNAVLVMGQDTVAPEKPKIIGAYLDSLDRAVVMWSKNTEPDLWGYRIFKSNFDNDEFSLLNAYPTLDTMWIDTLDIDLGTKDIYYLVEAADKRNNRSPLSDTIRIELPDRIPPLPPMISKVEQVADSIVLHFAPSGSEDATALNFYRRDIDQSGWERIMVFPHTDTIGFVVDTTYAVGTHYAYTVTASDQAGNESVPEFYKEIISQKKKIDFKPFKNIEFTIQEKEQKILLEWKCNDDKILKSVMVYKGNDPTRMSKLDLVDYPEESIQDDLSAVKDGVVYYRLKPNFENQDQHYMSDLIKVEIDSKGK